MSEHTNLENLRDKGQLLEKLHSFSRRCARYHVSQRHLRRSRMPKSATSHPGVRGLRVPARSSRSILRFSHAKTRVASSRPLAGRRWASEGPRAPASEGPRSPASGGPRSPASVWAKKVSSLGERFFGPFWARKRSILKGRSARGRARGKTRDCDFRRSRRRSPGLAESLAEALAGERGPSLA